MLSPDFNKPAFYTFFGVGSVENGNSKIHASRVVRMDGTFLPDDLMKSNGYWHDSVLSKPYDAIRNYAEAHDSISGALKGLS